MARSRTRSVLNLDEITKEIFDLDVNSLLTSRGMHKLFSSKICLLTMKYFGSIVVLPAPDLCDCIQKQQVDKLQHVQPKNRENMLFQVTRPD